jgi:uncharacterized protein with ACT and thioredoxin-like domain
VNFAAGDVDEEQNVERHKSRQRPNLFGEEVAGDQHVLVGRDEVGPTLRCLALRRWRDAVFAKDIADGRVADVVAEFHQRAGDAVVAPSRILASELEDQIDHSLLYLGPSEFCVWRCG